MKQSIKISCDDPSWMPNISKRLKQILDSSNVRFDYEFSKNEINVKSSEEIPTRHFVNLSKEFPGQTTRAYFVTSEGTFCSKCYYSFKNGDETLDDMKIVKI
jgi:hypothetical protein